MFVFIVIIFIIIVFSNLSADQNFGSIRLGPFLYTRKGVYLFIVGFFCILFPALRADVVGLDTIVYKDSVLYYVKSDLMQTFANTRFEPGYVFLEFVAKQIGSFVFLQTVVTFLFIYSVIKLVKEYSNIVWFSMLLFILYGFYYLSFNEMRQAIALGLSCFVFKAILDKKIISFLFWLFLSMLFHFTVLIILPCYLFAYLLRINFWYVLGILVALVIMYSMYFLAFDFLNSYSTIMYSEDENTGGLGLLALQLLTLGLAFFYRSSLNKERVNVVLFFLLGYSIILFPICSVNPAMFRLEQYSWIYMILLIPRIVQCIQTPFIKWSAIFCYTAIGFYLGFDNYYTVDNQIFPYLFFWQL